MMCDAVRPDSQFFSDATWNFENNVSNNLFSSLIRT